MLLSVTSADVVLAKHAWSSDAVSCDRDPVWESTEDNPKQVGGATPFRKVPPFVANGIITAKWGKKKQSYQVLELRVFETGLEVQ